MYWHGVFGGIYFPHLRADAYASLLKAERILSERRVAAGEQRDYDVDGYDEYIFRGNAGAVFVHVQGGAIIEWDIYASATNLVDTLARRPEAEHKSCAAPRRPARSSSARQQKKSRSPSTRPCAQRSAASRSFSNTIPPAAVSSRTASPSARVSR